MLSVPRPSIKKNFYKLEKYMSTAATRKGACARLAQEFEFAIMKEVNSCLLDINSVNRTTAEMTIKRMRGKEVKVLN